ncbi:50S ribosomal protein L24e [Salinigranum halophilum]|uniref:50S ribosomal protein L24e n=1 Tax=Salinigranum halophilum TaxID=2565931 RepID=UPI00115D4A76
MVEKRTCDYTGDDIEPGTGTMFVKTDGTVLHFKDSKAEKNYLLGREARDLEWTTTGRRQAERAQASRDAGATQEAEAEDDAAEADEDDEAEVKGADEDVEADATEADEDDEEDDEE